MSEVKDTQHPKVEIAVKNFGPIAEAHIDLRPLTVFVGPSNTGKTYFATQIYALHRIFNGFSESGFLSPFGPMNFTELMAGNNPERGDLLDLAVAEEDIQELVGLFRKLSPGEEPFKLSNLPTRIQNQLRDIIKESEVFKDPLQEGFKNCFDLNSILSLIRLTEEQHSEMSISLKVSEGNQECWKINLTVSNSGIIVDGSAGEGIHLFPKGWSMSISGSASEKEHRVSFDHPWPNSLKRNPYYLPAARSGIMQSHRVIASSLVTRATRVGLEQFEIPTLSGVIADFMQEIILYDEKKIPNAEMIHLAETLETEVLAGQIHLKPSSSGYPDFRYRPQGIEEEMRLSQASSMVSELAPLVLFLRSGIKPGDTLIIEEPEAHLHPGAQADMAVILARLVRAGVKVIITTHSDWLLQEISNLTLEGLLAEETDEPASWLLPEEVGVWHFQKDQPVKEIPFKPREGISPEDYEDVAEGLYNRSVNLQQKLEKKKGKSERESA